MSVMNKTRSPKIAGKLSVTSGSRFVRISGSRSVLLFWSNSVPHTRQRVALSLNRVPQTGQSFVDEGFFSGLIINLD